MFVTILKIVAFFFFFFFFFYNLDLNILLALLETLTTIDLKANNRYIYLKTLFLYGETKTDRVAPYVTSPFHAKSTILPTPHLTLKLPLNQSDNNKKLKCTNGRTICKSFASLLLPNRRGESI